MLAIPIRAVIFDFIGTLASISKSYSLEASKLKMYNALYSCGFRVDFNRFMEAYNWAHEKYKAIRYQKFIEVTNAVWISDALKSLGFEVAQDDPRVKVAVNVFFHDYLYSFRIRRCAKKVLTNLSGDYKLGLVSNFTYAPLIYAALRMLKINRFFNAILVSDAVGWRKPHPKIFEEALSRLRVKPEETVYVGDSPEEDIKGAKQLGMKTIYVESQFYPFEALKKSTQTPDATAKNLCEVYDVFLKIVNV